MKIGIIAFGFYPGQTGGTETYFRNLLFGLQKYDAENSYVVVVDEQYLDDATALVQDKNWRVIGMSRRPSFVVRLLRKFRLIKGDDESLLASKIDGFKFDLVHFPFQAIFPKGINAKKVVTFHDMQEKHYPEFFTEAELATRDKTFGPAIASADAIIAISDYTKQDIEKYHSAGYKCVVVYHSYDPSKASEANDLARGIKKKHYFYYPAATWPHKNHQRLIKAFAKMYAKNPDYQLVFTGISRQKSSEIDKLINELDLRSAVINLGYVDYDALPSIYTGAFALIYPSLFEGFGLPILEAMNAGIPVVASSESSVPEVGGDAVLYCDPKSISDISSKMTILVNDNKIRSQLVSKGKLQLKKFTTKNMIEGTLNAYERAYNAN